MYWTQDDVHGKHYLFPWHVGDSRTDMFNICCPYLVGVCCSSIHDQEYKTCEERMISPMRGDARLVIEKRHIISSSEG